MTSAQRQEGAGQGISVLLVEDDRTTRTLLERAIGSAPMLSLSAAFDRATPALAWLEQNTVDLLLTDLGLPDGCGIDIIRACAARHPTCSIMVVTMSSDEEQVLACIEAGASGYVLKNAGQTDIVRALLDLHAGGSPISPVIARKVLARLRGQRQGSGRLSGHGRPDTAHKPAEALADGKVHDRKGSGPSRRAGYPLQTLTRRETTILELIGRGDSYAEVASVLKLSVGTVQTHVKNIYGKLAVHSRGAAVFEAQRRGLLHLETLKGRLEE
ncbi:MAG: response regulator [Janthinobacterium lividum]